jgi:hypothetical protein
VFMAICSIFSSSVMAATSSAARCSGERLVFNHGSDCARLEVPFDGTALHVERAEGRPRGGGGNAGIELAVKKGPVKGGARSRRKGDCGQFTHSDMN